MGTMAFTLADFNAAPVDRLTTDLADLFGSPALAESVAASRPYDSVDQLCATASALLTAQDRESRRTVCDAVNAHPPIGGTVAAGTPVGQRAGGGARRDRGRRARRPAGPAAPLPGTVRLELPGPRGRALRPGDP